MIEKLHPIRPKWLARSLNGGTTWKEQVVSNHRFKPKPIVGGASNYQGDHIALTSSEINSMPFGWMISPVLPDLDENWTSTFWMRKIISRYLLTLN